MVGLLFFQKITFATVRDLQFQVISVATPAYEEMIALRMQVLLQPIGIPRTYIEPEKEAKDLLLGAYKGDSLVGCCILTERSETTVQLRQMAVEPSLQKTGIGAALLRFAESTAIGKGYRQIMMHARDNVLSFYKKSGYQICSGVFYEVGIAHHRMIKDLPASQGNQVYS